MRLSEHDFIASFSKGREGKGGKKGRDVVVGIGDDAAVLSQFSGQMVVTTDTIIEGRHFYREWYSAKHIGYKAVEVNVSDIAAMGAVPKFALVSYIIPKSLSTGFMKKLNSALWERFGSYDVSVVGGNISSGKELSVTVTLIGELSKGKGPVLRSGAKVGDFVVLSKEVGSGRAGLRSFEKNLGVSSAEKLQLNPYADLDFSLGYGKYMTSCIDVSDGVAADLGHICTQSGVGALVYKQMIPIGDEARLVARRLEEDSVDYALFGGEDYALLFTVSPKDIRKVSGYMIGEIVSGKGVKLVCDGKASRITKKGWDHFVD